MASPIVSLIPPPLRNDARVKALLSAFEAELDAMDNRALLMLDPASAPELVLPYLSFETSLDEFIGPRLPVDTIRTLIANAWRLHEPKGYQDGIEGGIAMLGLAATLISWWQENPKRRRGTHRIEIPIDRPIWPDRTEIGAEDMSAIWRMIHAMQRWSQDHALQLVSEASVPVTVAVAVGTGLTLQIEPFDPGPVEVTTSARAGVGIIVSRTLTIEGRLQ